MFVGGSLRGQRSDKGLLFAALALFVGVSGNGGGGLETGKGGDWCGLVPVASSLQWARANGKAAAAGGAVRAWRLSNWAGWVVSDARADSSEGRTEGRCGRATDY